MIGRFVTLFILQIIIIGNLVYSKNVLNCGLAIVDNTAVFAFRNVNETFIEQCLDANNKKIKWLSIQDCFITSVVKILTAIRDFSLFEELVIYNSGLGNIDISIYDCPKLKILNLSLNSLSNIYLDKTPSLETLDLSFNKLNNLVLMSEKFGKLKELNLYGNSFTVLQINLKNIQNINLSNSLSPNMSYVSVTIQNSFYSMDLSRNGLSDIKFLNIKRDFNVLDLNDNNIGSLVDLLALSQPNYHLQIYLHNNQLICSPELTVSWLTLRNRNISFDEDLSCTFSQSENKYPIKKYGWMFSNETDILNNEWAITQLNAFLEFRSISFRVDVKTEGLSAVWTNRNTSNQECLLQLKSKTGLVVHSKNITMISQLPGRTNINYKEMSQISEVCILLSVKKLTREGVTKVYVNVQCTELVRITNTSKADFRTMFIVLTILLLIICLALSLYITYIHKIKLQKKDSINKNEMELKPNVEHQISPYIQTTGFNNKSYISNSVYCDSPSPDPMRQNTLISKPKSKPNLYISMDHHDSYRISRMDNVYDGMDSLTKPTIPTDTRAKEADDVYDFCE